MKLQKVKPKVKTKTVTSSVFADPPAQDFNCEVCDAAPAVYRDIRDGVVVWSCKACILKQKK